MPNCAKAVSFLGAIAVGVVQAQAASAERVCASYDTVVSRLAEVHGETPRLRGTTRSNYTLEVFASSDFRTWTVTVRSSDGPTCLLSTGTGQLELDATIAGLG